MMTVFQVVMIVFMVLFAIMTIGSPDHLDKNRGLSLCLASIIAYVVTLLIN